MCAKMIKKAAGNSSHNSIDLNKIRLNMIRMPIEKNSIGL